MAESADPAAHPTPDRIMQYAWGFAAPQILKAALDLEVFTQIASGRDTLSALEIKTRASHRGLPMLVDALVGLGLLVRNGPRDSAKHELAPDAKAFLVKGAPGYLGDNLSLLATKIAKDFNGLSECVRTGTPAVAVDAPKEGIELWHALVDGLFHLNLPAAQNLAQEILRTQTKRPLRVLDVACGSGVWGLAHALAEPSTRVTLSDLAGTLPHARAFAQKLGVASRVDYLEGDLREADFGDRRYDLAILGHICHSEGTDHSKTLFEKMARALVPGGTLAIAEFLPDEDRRGPPMPLIFALNMLVHTSEGSTFTFGEFRGWLAAGGFKDVRLLPGPSVSPLILATR